jgi:choline dehydrogenase
LDRFPADSSCCLRLLIGFDGVEADHGEQLSAVGGVGPQVVVEGNLLPGRVLRRKTREGSVRRQAFDDIRGEEYAPGAKAQSDAELDAYIKANCNSVYHPVGTCKMGSDAMAVVNDRLQVHGIEQLRVVDASVMPTLTSGNTNAPTIMIGEKAADFILGKAA